MRALGIVKILHRAAPTVPSPSLAHSSPLPTNYLQKRRLCVPSRCPVDLSVPGRPVLLILCHTTTKWDALAVFAVSVAETGARVRLRSHHAGRRWQRPDFYAIRTSSAKFNTDFSSRGISDAIVLQKAHLLMGLGTRIVPWFMVRRSSRFRRKHCGRMNTDGKVHPPVPASGQRPINQSDLLAPPGRGVGIRPGSPGWLSWEHARENPPENNPGLVRTAHLSPVPGPRPW